MATPRPKATLLTTSAALGTQFTNIEATRTNATRPGPENGFLCAVEEGKSMRGRYVAMKLRLGSG
jgi:hypothetical protein